MKKPSPPLVILILFIFAFSPFIIGFIGGTYHEYVTGETCHEGNCSWAVLGWIGIFGTMPLSILLFIIYGIVSVFLKIRNRKKHK